MINRTRKPLMAAIAVGAMFVATQAFAHAHLVSSTPAANATLTAAPKTITLTFNEKLVPAFSKFELTMPEHGGMKVPVKTAVSKDGKSITGTTESALAKGAYKIIWSAASADGHKMNGEVAFKVG
jgi:copper resistance protein C